MKSKIIILLFLCTLIPNYLVAFTSHKKDSAPISTKQSIYLNNIEILTGLATKVYKENPERSLQYAVTALEIAQKHEDKQSIEKILIIIGDIYKQSDFDRLAIPFYNRAIEISKENNHNTELVKCYQNMGDVYYKLNSIDSAITFYKKSFELYTLQKNQKGIAEVYISLGNTYWYTAGYDKALELYLKALFINEQIKNNSGICEVYTNIGSLYTLLGDYQNAKNYFHKVIPRISDFDKPDNIANFYYRYGNMFETVGQFDSAFYYFDASKSVFDSLKLERKSGYIDLSIGNIFSRLNKLDKAIHYTKTGLAKFEKYNFKYGMAQSYNDLCSYYLKLEDFTNSLNYLNKAYKLSKEIKSVELLKNSYLNYSNYYKDKGAYKKALDYYSLYQEMNDSVLNKEKNTRIAELQTRFETERKEKEIAEKTQELSRNYELINRQKRNLYIFGAGIIVILIMSIALYHQYKLIEIKGSHIQKINEELDHRVKERTAALQLTQFSVEHAADPIFWINKEGMFIFANNAACNYLDYTKEEFNHLNLFSIIPRFSKTDWEDVWEIIRLEGSVVLEIDFAKRNNVSFPVEIALNFIAHEGKEYAFAFIRDISDRKLKEENLRKAKEKAEEADKLKSAFLANMSHEIRTPMNAILGFSDLLLNEGLSINEKEEFAGIIKSSADTLLKLIDDIIDISLIDAKQLKISKSVFQVNTILKEINRFYQQDKNRIQKSHIDIRLNETYFNDKIALNTDPVRFRQVITNLVGNALKFTDNGFIEIGYIPGPRTMRFYVKDSGIGIAKEKLVNIFERFTKLNSNNKLYSGTGLGLAISKKIVEQMGGNLKVASEPQKGSIFWFTVPYIYSNNLTTETKPEKKIKASTNWKNKKILIVEDVESNYYFLESILKRTKVNISWAKEGDTALDYCKNNRPDLVLMDIQLPGNDGYTVTRNILNLYPNLPIIAQTAFAFSNEKEKILEAGCVDYLTKPIDTDLLFELIQKYIG